MKGTVKWFDNNKGYGFITGEDGKEVFVHFKGITEGRSYVGFKQDDQVEYEVESGKNGPQAKNAKLIK